MKSMKQLSLAETGLTMKRDSVVDAPLTAAPSTTKNKDRKRDPEMAQTKKATSGTSGGMHMLVSMPTAAVHIVECTTAKVADITMMEACLHDEEAIAFGDRGYHKKHRTIDEFEKKGDQSVLTPTKKLAGDVLTEEQKTFSRILSAIRAVI